ncbi:MAG: hypothetical protein HQM10_22090 [Candidatus Riflebacteria bacterium]|nr:hypothetical protein [Candidatus Riflebacteria bacterium]
MKILFCLMLISAPLMLHSAELPLAPYYVKGDYAHSSVKSVRIGIEEEKIYLFSPSDPEPASAPVVMFLRGWTHYSHSHYRAWIDHLCRQGNVVVFPEFQGSGGLPKDFTINTARSLKESLKYLEDRRILTPDRETLTVIGHECGAVIALNYAAAAKNLKLPTPKGLFLMNPSRSPFDEEGSAIPLLDLSRISSDTLLMIIAGEDDSRNGFKTAIDLFYECDYINTENKLFLTSLTDARGVPALVGDSFAPTSSGWPESERAIEKHRYDFVRSYMDRFNYRSLRGRDTDTQDTGGYRVLFDFFAMAAIKGLGKDSFFTENNPLFDTLGEFSDGRHIRGFDATRRP